MAAALRLECGASGGCHPAASEQEGEQEGGHHRKRKLFRAIEGKSGSRFRELCQVWQRIRDQSARSSPAEPLWLNCPMRLFSPPGPRQDPKRNGSAVMGKVVGRLPAISRPRQDKGALIVHISVARHGAASVARPGAEAPTSRDTCPVTSEGQNALCRAKLDSGGQWCGSSWCPMVRRPGGRELTPPSCSATDLLPPRCLFSLPLPAARTQTLLC